MTTKVLVLNGPNLGRLGSRQPDVYGALTYEGLVEHLVETGKPLGFDVDVRQTEHEGQMIEWLHEAANVFAREEFRHHSVLSAGAAGVIVGCGVGGYDLALAHLASLA